MAMQHDQSLDALPTRWSRSGSVVSDLILMVLIIVAIVGIASGKFLVAAICGLVLVLTFISRLWARLALVNVDYHCLSSQDRLMEGDTFDLILTVENRKPLPLLWLSVFETVPDGLQLENLGEPGRGRPGAKQIRDGASLGPYERIKFQHQIRAMKRGHYGFGPTRIVSGDIFGFYKVQLDALRRRPCLVVYPRTVPLPEFRLPARQPIGDISSRAKFLDDPTRPSGLREYKTGDAARQIDWKATARRNSVFVRTYDSSQAQRVVILLECNTSSKSWRFFPSILEAATTGAASVAVRSIELGYAVGLVCNGYSPSGPAPPMVAPGAGPEQLTALMTALAGVNMLTSGSLEKIARRYGGEALPPDATVVYIAGVFRPSTVDFICDLRDRGHRVAALNIGEEDPPEIAGLQIADYRGVFAAAEAIDD